MLDGMERWTCEAGRGFLLGLLLWGSGGCLGYEPLPEAEGSEPVAIAALRAEPPPDGTEVFVGPAVVLAHDTFDESGAGRLGTVYLADPGQPEGGSLQVFSAQLALSPGESLRPGDLVRGRGPFFRFRGPGCTTDPSRCFAGGRAIDQLGQGSRLERIGVWRAPEPIELSVDAYLAEPARFQGRLVTLRDLTVREGYRPSARGDRIQAASTEQGVAVGAELYRVPGLEPGARIARLTGVSTFFYADVVQPRGPQDVELAP